MQTGKDPKLQHQTDRKGGMRRKNLTPGPVTVRLNKIAFFSLFLPWDSVELAIGVNCIFPGT